MRKNIKRILALLVSLILIFTASLNVLGLSFGEVQTLPDTPYLSGTGVTTDTHGYQVLGSKSIKANQTLQIEANDDYIFVATGQGLPNDMKNAGISVFKKSEINSATEETMSSVKPVAQIVALSTSTGLSYNPYVRNMWATDGYLYVSWGNGMRGNESIAYRVNGDTSAPTYVYDLSALSDKSGSATANVLTSSGTIDSGNAYAAESDPFNIGGVSYFDKENNVIYTTKANTNDFSNRLAYSIKKIDGTTVTESKYFQTYHTVTTEGVTSVDASRDSRNTAKFIVKDGWLFEILQQYAGIGQYNRTTASLTGNNKVLAYDLNSQLDGDRTNGEITTVYTANNMASQLCGVFETANTDNRAIVDIEVVGDYMYLATTKGLEVVNFAAAKADGAKENPASLTSTVIDSDLSITDLELVENNLFAATSTGVYAYSLANPAAPSKIDGVSALAGTSVTSIAVDGTKVYALKASTQVHWTNQDEMYCFEFTITEPSISSVTFNGAETVDAGTGDIKVNISNPDGIKGKLMCAIYEGNEFVDVLYSDSAAPNGEIVIASDYKIDSSNTRIKAMYFADLINVRPLCNFVEITKETN